MTVFRELVGMYGSKQRPYFKANFTSYAFLKTLSSLS